MNRRSLIAGLAGTAASALALTGPAAAQAFEVTRSDADWRARLAPDAYRVLRQQGTERPGSSPLDKEKRAGLFGCKGCGLPLFSSRTKFESGTGWPSFYAPLRNAVRTRVDTSLMMRRIEVVCRRCGGHLGHVFDDGPPPTGKRYCMNGVAMIFRPGKA
jgi:peptide-methionine (R)-S-oxide reductase